MTNSNFPYNSPTPGEITILAKTPYTPNKSSEITKEVFKTIEQCGFNAICVADSKENTQRCFEELNSNLKIIIGWVNSNPNMQSDIIDLAKKYHSNNKLGGYELKDEPFYNDLIEQKNVYDKIWEIDNKHIIDINLACDFDPKSELGISLLGPFQSLNEFIDNFQKKFMPSLWSYDYYPISSNGGTILSNVSEFFKFMQLFYEKAIQTNRPLWTYCMCMPYVNKCIKDAKTDTCKLNDPSKNGRPVPTIGELRFEAFSALAYGAQGIVYWAYTQRGGQRPASSSPEFGIEGYYTQYYLSAPIDIYGNKTSIWYRVQRVNNEIKRYNHVFCGCEVIEVAHVGKVYPGTQAYTTDFGYFKTLTAQNEGVLVSHIQKGGVHYLIIVNHNPLGTQHVTINFLNPEKIIELADVDMAPVEGQRLLGPGGYVIFRVK